MSLEILIDFFMWCTLINGVILLIWGLIYMFIPDLMYRAQSNWFQVSRENYNSLSYLLLGLFKIFYIFFNLVPFLALSFLVE